MTANEKKTEINKKEKPSKIKSGFNYMDKKAP